MSRRRLDEEVVARGLLETRSRARAYIMAGDVLLNGQKVTQAGKPVATTDRVELVEARRFVSRGGDKLAGALDRFGVDPTGSIAADLGASTGGFTDCLLQRGATKVYAVDVGYGQLDDRLRRDERVVVMERTNARLLEGLPEPVDIVVIDVSFISLALIFPVAARLLRIGGHLIPLIKPQFEAGPKDVGKNGVVRDPEVHRRVLREAIESATANGFHVEGLTASTLLGPAGNAEFLGHLVRVERPHGVDIDVLVEAAMAAIPVKTGAVDTGAATDD
ncbi:MAG TPA: TlyA family RNA methyltransferase [Thermomicrobiales bacterium]|jgi:23S rRNA (cytidine1920-2'-O)/16S rRNA (cytidine1409-2'-O)-methyltransferase|nr:TlyA family RNA methyltransferase [Thermomicrobiales bacterium]